MSNGNGHRWSKFWWCDWQNDQQLKLCSLAAQGLWMRLLCMMYDANGYLLVSGVQPNVRQIAKITSTSERQVERYLAELLLHSVARKDNYGVIYCKRMVADFAAGEAGKQWGKRGGNPSLNPHGGLTPSLNPKDGNGVNPPPYPPPLNQKLEAEEEAERDPPTPPQAGGSTPASPGTPQAGRRADESNPREKGTNPRNRGTNPRAPAHREGGFVSGGIAVLAERLLQIAAERQPHDDDLTDERSYFSGLKVVEGGRG